MLDSKQVRAARGLLDWTQETLAERSGVARATIKNVESGCTFPRVETANAMQRAFEEAGVEFLPSSGVRMRDRMVKILEGPDSYRRLLDDIYITALNSDKDIIIAPANPREANKILSEALLREEMNKRRAANIKQRLLVRADDPFRQPLETYRILPDEYCSPYPLYIYGDKIALVYLQEPYKAIIIHDDRFASGIRKLVNFIWDRTEMPSHKKED